jgi:hypothetical protein
LLMISKCQLIISLRKSSVVWLMFNWR